MLELKTVGYIHTVTCHCFNVISFKFITNLITLRLNLESSLQLTWNSFSQEITQVRSRFDGSASQKRGWSDERRTTRLIPQLLQLSTSIRWAPGHPSPFVPRTDSGFRLLRLASQDVVAVVLNGGQFRDFWQRWLLPSFCGRSCLLRVLLGTLCRWSGTVDWRSLKCKAAVWLITVMDYRNIRFC